MIADGGVGKSGTTYQYYVCKTARKNKCAKKREDKNELEKYVTEMTVGYLSDKRRVQRIADDMIAHHERRTETSVLRSLEVRIANTQKEIDDTTTAYIQAVATKNDLLVGGCDKRMKELTALLECLQDQHIRLEIERGSAPTHERIFAFLAELTGSNLTERELENLIADKAYQKQIIGRLVNSVYLYDGRTVIYFSFEDGESPFIGKDDTDQAINNAVIEKIPDTTEFPYS